MKWLAAAFLIFIGCIGLVFATESTPAVIALQPLGDAKAERLLVVKQGLEKAYGLKVETLPAKLLPKSACVMRDAEASIATVDAETGTFCEPCAKAWLEWLQQKGN